MIANFMGALDVPAAFVLCTGIVMLTICFTIYIVNRR